MERKFRITIPTCPKRLKPKWPDLEKFCKKESMRKQQAKCNFDRRHRTRLNPPLLPDDIVYIKDMNTTGTVTGPADTSRYCNVQTRKGNRRNRTHLSLLPREEATTLNPKEDNPPSPCLNSRPERLKPTWKVKENSGQ